MGLAFLSKQVTETIAEFIKYNQIWYLRVLLFRVFWKKTCFMMHFLSQHTCSYMIICLFTQTNKCNNDNVSK